MRGALSRALVEAGALALVLCVACSGSDEERSATEVAAEPAVREPPASTETPERGPTRREREGASSTPGIARPGDEPSADAVVVYLAVRPSTEAEGEDGRGHVVPARAPVALELVRDDGWPGRALDPVLHLGELRFTRYEHASPLVLRYVAADRDALPSGAAAAVQWGDDEASRIVLTPLLDGDPTGDVRP